MPVSLLLYWSSFLYIDGKTGCASPGLIHGAGGCNDNADIYSHGKATAERIPAFLVDPSVPDYHHTVSAQSCFGQRSEVAGCVGLCYQK